ncbi:FAD-dependent oxidoreductase [Spirillospora sp. NPDC048824]|uniref:hydroxysqualene dehydroxylase n=1 Tax=Spirillospora sp. NPDC048824 TaxID=3364526 RepID=UPI0037160343
MSGRHDSGPADRPTRRRFLGGAAAVGAGAAVAGVLGGEASAQAGWQAGPAGARRRAAGRRVAVFGGGIAGLSAALELAERGFAVTVYERRQLGGKARVFGVPGSARGGRDELPAEHGFRFFPGFYQNLPDSMRRIPFPGNEKGTWDNLTRASTYLGARKDRPDLTIPFPFPWPIPEGTPPFLTPESLISTLISGLQSLGMIPLPEILHFVRKGVMYVTSCDERRVGQWDHVSWADFLGTATRSEEYNTLLADGLVRNLAAMKSADASTHAIGLVGEATLWSVLGEGNEAGGSVDRVLAGATDEMLIDPWVAHLKTLGVRFQVGWAAESFQLSGGRIASAVAVDPAGARHTVDADWFVSAVPLERADRLVDHRMRAADPMLNNISKLRNDWMNGLMFFLKREVPITPGHVNYWDSTWAITSISQAQFWKRDFTAYGDGTVTDNLSAIISDWNTPGMFNGKTAKECSREEIAEEAWKQIKAHVNKPGKPPVLTDDMLHTWYLDPGILNPGTPQVANEDPLFIQTLGAYETRPTAGTGIENFFLAGDWVKTGLYVSTMETANEGGRLAANALLDAAGHNGDKAAIGELWIAPAFNDAKKLDQERYRDGEPHILDDGI